MSDNLKDNETLNELTRYINNKMSNEERYAFERALERDPFLAEALDGIQGFKSSDIERDLNSIDVISGKKKRQNKPVYYLVAAASISILIVSMFLFKRPQKQQVVKVDDKEVLLGFKSDSTFKSEVLPDSLNVEITDSGRVLLADFTEISPKEKKSETTLKIVDQKVNDKKQITESRKKVESNKTDEKSIPISHVNDEIVVITDSNIKEDSNVASSAVEIIDADLESKKTRRVGANAEPEPLGGKNLFNTYIDNNIQYPKSEEKGKREVVKIKFIVSELGDLSNFSVIKGPENEDFLKEAIRVLSQGPKWSPAVEDGLPVEKEVVLRIVFKP